MLGRGHGKRALYSAAPRAASLDFSCHVMLALRLHTSLSGSKADPDLHLRLSCDQLHSRRHSCMHEPGKSRLRQPMRATRNESQAHQCLFGARRGGLGRRGVGGWCEGRVDLAAPCKRVAWILSCDLAARGVLGRMACPPQLKA